MVLLVLMCMIRCLGLKWVCISVRKGCIRVSFLVRVCLVCCWVVSVCCSRLVSW